MGKPKRGAGTKLMAVVVGQGRGGNLIYRVRCTTQLNVLLLMPCRRKTHASFYY
jgi:hypothetical protein